MSGRGKTWLDLLSTTGQPISLELVELLAAHGPPEMPVFRGDVFEYAGAVKQFERLSATPEATARREAMERYFAEKSDN